MSNVTWGPHKLDIVKRFVKLLNVKVNTLSNLVVVVNMVTFGFALNRTQIKDSNSSTLSSVVPSHVKNIKPTQDGLKDALDRGLVAGFPVVDIKATLFDGSYHDVDSSEAAYKIAASMALKEAAKKCDPVILEPIMKIEVTVPEQYYGDVVGDIARRRGQMTGESQRGNAKIIEAEVPLAEMFGYVTDLRSFTQGRGNYTMQFDHFGECPRFIADEIIKKSGMSNR